MNDFSDDAFTAPSIDSTEGIIVKRVAIFLLLASFLRLQVACCCAGHREHGSAQQATHEGCCDHCEHASAELASNDECGKPVLHDHDSGKPAGSHHSHHICVISHLQYIQHGPMPSLDLLQCQPFAAVDFAGLMFARPSICEVAEAAAQPANSLLLCGALLRI